MHERWQCPIWVFFGISVCLLVGVVFSSVWHDLSEESAENVALQSTHGVAISPPPTNEKGMADWQTLNAEICVPDSAAFQGSEPSPERAGWLGPLMPRQPLSQIEIELGNLPIDEVMIDNGQQGFGHGSVQEAILDVRLVAPQLEVLGLPVVELKEPPQPKTGPVGPSFAARIEGPLTKANLRETIELGDRSARVASISERNKSEFSRRSFRHRDVSLIYGGSSNSGGIRFEKLLAELDLLAAHQKTANWARTTTDLVTRLGFMVEEGSEAAYDTLLELDNLVLDADRLVDRIDDRDLAYRLCRTRYALMRRLDVWKPAMVVGGVNFGTVSPPKSDAKRLIAAIDEVNALTGDSLAGDQWRKYLLLDALSGAATDKDIDLHETNAIARRMLSRLGADRLSEDQVGFLNTAPMKSLRAEVRRLVASPVDTRQLLRSIECFESFGLPSDARKIAESCMSLAAVPSASDGQRQLAARLEENYRNANFRIAFTAELLNMLLPEHGPEENYACDWILGNRVCGWRRTTADLSVRMIPDPNSVRMNLEVLGQIAASTKSKNWPATFFNSSSSQYIASKAIEFDTNGLHVLPTKVTTDNDTHLRKVQTAFDVVPILGVVAKNVAYSQHEKKRNEVRREIEYKVARRAKYRIDNEADPKFRALAEKLQTRFMEPMSKMSLGPKIISSETTEDSVVVRMRLASLVQLGANTPRPAAPEGSLASTQLHQSVLNNVAEQLNLDRRTFTIKALRHYISKQFNRPEMLGKETSNDDVKITFANKDAVHVQLDDGQVAVTLGIAKLKKGRKVWKNFQVRAFYKPCVDGISVELCRSGVIQLAGRYLSTGSQIALRGVFSKVFSKRRHVHLVPDRLVQSEKAEDLVVTQAEIGDGWIAVALGQK